MVDELRRELTAVARQCEDIQLGRREIRGILNGEYKTVIAEYNQKHGIKSKANVKIPQGNQIPQNNSGKTQPVYPDNLDALAMPPASTATLEISDRPEDGKVVTE